VIYSFFGFQRQTRRVPGYVLLRYLILVYDKKSVIWLGKMNNVRFDEIGYWSEIKLDIVREYAQKYSTILANQDLIQRYIYIDAFAGAGIHISKQTGEYIPGSPLNALNVQPPFNEYHFIDLDGDKAKYLRQLTENVPNVSVYHENCNEVLLGRVFPRARYDDYHRALCLLDPYALNLDWEVVQAAGQMKSIEIFPNFMVMDMNMNVLWNNPDNVPPSQLKRMNAFWGDRSWRSILYQKPRGLLPGIELEKKIPNNAVAAAYQDRLKKVAGFTYVPDPMPMRNTQGAIVYYLFFASPNKTGEKIVRYIFDKYRDRGTV
jgi:three-Cys-motif partner protein